MKKRTPKFRGFRKPWGRGDAAPVVLGHLNTAAIAFAERGSQGAIDVLGSRTKFANMAPAIKARVELMMRRFKDFEDLS